MYINTNRKTKLQKKDGMIQQATSHSNENSSPKKIKKCCIVKKKIDVEF